MAKMYYGKLDLETLMALVERGDRDALGWVFHHATFQRRLRAYMLVNMRPYCSVKENREDLLHDAYLVADKCLINGIGLPEQQRLVFLVMKVIKRKYLNIIKSAAHRLAEMNEGKADDYVVDHMDVQAGIDELIDLYHSEVRPGIVGKGRVVMVADLWVHSLGSLDSAQICEQVNARTLGSKVPLLESTVKSYISEVRTKLKEVIVPHSKLNEHKQEARAMRATLNTDTLLPDASSEGDTQAS